MNVRTLSLGTSAISVPQGENARRPRSKCWVLLAAFVVLLAVALCPVPLHGLAWTWVSLLVRSLAAVLIVRAAAAFLSLQEFEESLRTLRCPEPLALLLVQIVIQTSALRRESLHMAQAIQLRGATSRWGLVRPSCLRALPSLWLVRTTRRADRVARAMELRGFGESAE